MHEARVHTVCACAAAHPVPLFPNLHPVLLLASPPQVRLLLHGSDTFLGDAAAEAELFLTSCYIDLPLAGLCGPAVSISRLQRPFSAELRLQQQQEDAELDAANAEAAERGGLHAVCMCVHSGR